MPNLLSFAVTVKKAIDMKKIQNAINQNVDILVGFPGGRPHIEALHIEDEETGKKKGGSKVQKKDGKVVETWQLAMELHYGTANIPARPFLDDGIATKEEDLAQAFKKEVQKAIDGKKPNWDKIGTMAVGAVQEFVRSDYYKTYIPNSPGWIETKGSDTPLIDGGDLMNALTYVVEDKR